MRKARAVQARAGGVESSMRRVTRLKENDEEVSGKA